MKNIQVNNNEKKDNVITVSEETAALVALTARLDDIYNKAYDIAHEIAADDNTVSDLDNAYSSLRNKLLGFITQSISVNICLDATCI